MQRDYLGQDTKFPLNGKFESVKEVDLVIQDIQILITTITGERVMRPRYGCRLFKRIWDNIDDVAREGLRDIREAIEEFEPRVDLLQVVADVDRDQGSINFVITFNIKGENNPRNLVFPFNTNLSSA